MFWTILIIACVAIVVIAVVNGLLQQNIATRQLEKAGFVATANIPSILAIDEQNQKISFNQGLSGPGGLIYNFDDIIGFELLENESSVTKGGLGRAVVGGALFGWGGAAIGGITGQRKTQGICNSLILKITINNTQNPAIFVKLINTPTKVDSITYQNAYSNAHQAISLLQLITETDTSTPEPNQIEYETSTADEINKFKQLLDNGVITPEEFEGKKKQLLGL